MHVGIRGTAYLSRHCSCCGSGGEHKTEIHDALQATYEGTDHSFGRRFQKMGRQLNRESGRTQTPPFNGKEQPSLHLPAQSALSDEPHIKRSPHWKSQPALLLLNNTWRTTFVFPLGRKREPGRDCPQTQESGPQSRTRSADREQQLLPRMQLKMTPEPVEMTATASQAPSRWSRHVPVIEVNAASQHEENSHTMAIPVYNPGSPNMLGPRHARHARLMASEVKLQEWLGALAAATPPDQKPTTTETEGTFSRPHYLPFPCPYPVAPSLPVMPVVAGSPDLQKHPFLSLCDSKSRPCQLASHLHLHPSSIPSMLCPKRHR